MVESIPKQDNMYKSLFEDSPISLWEMDWSAIKDYLDNLRSTGVIDYRKYFENNPTAVSECLSLIKIIDVNNSTLELYKANNKSEFLGDFSRIITQESYNTFREALINIAEGKTAFKGENSNIIWNGDEIYTKNKITIPSGYEKSLKRVFISIMDITKHRNTELKLSESREMYRTLVENTQEEAKRKLKELEEKFKTISSVAHDGTISKLEIFRDITEFKEVSEKIKQAYSELDQIFNSSIAMCIIDKNFDIVNVNDTYSSLFHVKKEDLINKKCYDIWPGQYCNTPKCTLKQVLEGKDQWDYEKDKELSDGSKISTIMRATPLQSPEGEIIGVVESTTDISERKKVQRKLEESEEKFRTIAEQSLMGIGILQDEVFKYINKQFANIFGYSVDEILNWPEQEYHKLTHPEDLEFTMEQSRKKQLGEPDVITRYQFRGVKKTGEIIWLEIISHTFSYENNPADLIIILDITERKKVEEELKTSEKRFRTIAENFPNGAIVLYDHDLRYLLAEGEIIEKVGLTSEKMVGNNLRDLVTDEYYNALAPHYKAALNGETHRFEFEFGGIIHDTSTLPIKDSDGNIIAGMSISQDITERKKADKALRESEYKYRSLFDNMLEGCALCKIITDENKKPVDFIYLDVNDAFGRLTGLKKKDTIGHRVTEVIPGIKNSEPNLFKIYGKVALTGEKTKIEFLFEPLKMWLSISVYSPEKGYFVAVFDNITERKKAEQEFYLNSEIMSNLAEGIYLVRTSDLKIMWTNPRFEEMFGYNPGEIIGKHVTTVNYPVDKTPEETAAEIVGVLEETGEWHGEVNNIKKDGTSFWCYANVSVFDHPEYGEVLVAVHTDITERKKREKEVSLNSQMMKNLNEGVNLIRASDLIIVYANPRFEEMFGYNPGEIIGKHAAIINVPTDKNPEEIAEEILNVMEETGEWHGEINNIKKDGTSLWCYANVSTFEHPEYGTVFVSILIDITTRKKAEQELRLQSVIMTNLSEGVHLIRMDDGIIVYTNPRFEEMFGYDPGELIGKHISIVNAPTDKSPEERAKRIMEILEETGEWHGEVNNIKKDGTPFWCYANVSAFDHPKYGKVTVAIHTDITERKNAEQKLKESEEKFRTIAEQSLMGIGILQDDVFKYINKQYANIFGYSVDEILNWPEKEYYILTHPEDLEITVEQARKKQLGESDVINQYQFRGVKKTGETVWLEIISHTFSYKNKPADLITILDITERKNAEQKLKESEARYRLITENANDLIAVLNEKFEYEFINEEAHLRITGFSKEELLGKTPVDFIHPDDFDIAQKNLIRQFESDEDLVELRVKHKEGGFIWLEEEGRTFIAEDGKKKIITIGRVITKRRQAEEELKVSLENYKSLFDSSIIGIILTNQEGIITNVNPATASILGYDSAEDMIGLPAAIIYIDPTRRVPFLQRASKRGYLKDIEVKLKKKDGTHIDTMVNAIIHNDIEGNFLRGELFFKDITERKKAEKDIINLAKFPSENPNPVLRATKEKVIYINEAGEKLFNIKEGEIIPLLMQDVVSDVFSVNEIKKLEIEHGNQIYSYVITPVEAEDYVNIYGRDITERKKAEENLKESIQRLRSFMDSSTDGFILFDSQLNYIDINKISLQILGMNKEDVIGKSLLDIAPHLKETGRYDKYMDVIKTGEPFSTEDVIFNRQDGTMDYCLSVRAFKVGENLGMAFTDITERKKAEKDIINLAKFPSENPNPVLRATKEKVIYINEAGEKLFNIKEGEIIPLLMQDVVSDVFSVNEIKKLEIEHGNQIYSYVITPVEAEDYVNIYGRDITERKKAEEMIKESEEKFRTFSEQSFMGISILQDNVFMYVNRTFAEIFGYSSDELLNLQQGDFIELVHPEDRDLVIEQVSKRQLGDLKMIYNYQYRGIRKNGDVIWLDVFGKTINYEGRPASYRTLINITEKKKIEEIKSKLLTRFSHEFKTPLVSIHGYIDLLINEYSESFDSETMSILKEAKHGSTRLKQLINLFIESSKLEEKLVKANLAENNLYDLITLCFNELKGLIRLRAHTIDIDLREDLTLMFDREKLKDVISNLLVNAVKYTPPGGNIEIKSRIEDNFLVISIKDNGIGLTENEKLQLFKQFGKIERYGQGWNVLSEGSGMGLYISKELIELHGGKIWAESMGRNRGSTFYFSLPLKR